MAPTGVLLVAGEELAVDEAGGVEEVVDDVVTLEDPTVVRGSASRIAWPEKILSSQLKRVKIRLGVAVVDQM